MLWVYALYIYYISIRLYVNRIFPMDPFLLVDLIENTDALPRIDISLVFFNLYLRK